MASDYIPRTDADFQNWVVNFSALITAGPTDYGLTAPEATTLAGLTSTFNDALIAATNGSTRGPMTVAAKDTARANLEAFARNLAMKVQNTSTVSNDQKAALRITIRKTGKTPRPAPTTRPIIAIKTVAALQHILEFSDETTSTSRKKPFGVANLMLSWWITPVGTTPSGLPTKSLPFSSNPVVINFDNADVMKMVSYQACWVTLTGLMGPVSNTAGGAIIGSPFGVS